jgi:hypothetical protein
MKFYFSGIGSGEELSWLEEAGIKRRLVDPSGLPLIDWRDNPDVMYDGAYHAFKAGKVIDLKAAYEYVKTVRQHPFKAVAAPDVIGDAEATLRNWDAVKGCTDVPWVPVWQWGSSRRILYRLLDEAAIVGVGACVPWMRVDNSRKRTASDIQADEQRREANLQELKVICRAHGYRLHVFGLCWVKAIEELAPDLYSADSSHWLVGARKGAVIFENSKTGRLSQAPARVLPFAKGWNRRRRCIENARAIARFLGEPFTG